MKKEQNLKTEEILLRDGDKIHSNFVTKKKNHVDMLGQQPWCVYARVCVCACVCVCVFVFSELIEKDKRKEGRKDG